MFCSQQQHEGGFLAENRKNSQRSGSSSILIIIIIIIIIRVDEKEREKIGKYQDLKREVTRLWNMRKVQVIPVVIGALGSVSKEFEKWTESLKIPCITIEMQKTALLGTARILRRVLDM